MSWIKDKYWALQLYYAALQMGDRHEAEEQALYLFGLERKASNEDPVHR